MLIDEGGTACECGGHSGSLNERPFLSLVQKTSNAEQSIAAINCFSAV